MKVEIDQLGMMKVSAETPLEAYALQKWTDNYQKKAGNADLCIETGFDNLLV